MAEPPNPTPRKANAPHPDLVDHVAGELHCLVRRHRISMLFDDARRWAGEILKMIADVNAEYAGRQQIS